MAEIPVADIPLADLLDEIDREEAALELLRVQLVEAEAEVRRLEEQLEWERVAPLEERIRQRAARIAEIEARLRRWPRRIADREARIRRLERRIAELSLFYPRSPTLGIMRRRITALRGWQTRDRNSDARDRRTLAALRGWQTREEAFIERQRELSAQIAHWSTVAGDIDAQITEEEERIELKRQRVRMVQVEVTLVSITESKEPDKEYTKRFQGYYLVDASRDPETGAFNLDHALTQEELDRCYDDFYERWNWIKEGLPFLPRDTSPPELTDVSSFTPIVEPEGAWFLYCSVIEDRVEERFGRRTLIYAPTPREVEAFKRELGL